jgi:hypothetical protein
MEAQPQGNNPFTRQAAKEFFELGQAFAFSEMSFNHLRFQAKVYGGEFERSCLELENQLAGVKSQLDVRERINAPELRKELVQLDCEIHRLQSRVVSIFLVSRQAGYDVVG